MQHIVIFVNIFKEGVALSSFSSMIIFEDFLSIGFSSVNVLLAHLKKLLGTNKDKYLSVKPIIFEGKNRVPVLVSISKDNGINVAVSQ